MVDSKVGDWFCYDDGRHWPIMVVTDDSSRDDARLIWMLLYLGTAVCLRSRFASLLEGGLVCDGQRITAVTWEAHANPAAREAELLTEYSSGSESLRKTYGALHGNHVRTSRLIAKARETVQSARALRQRARHIRARP